MIRTSRIRQRRRRVRTLAAQVRPSVEKWINDSLRDDFLVGRSLRYVLEDLYGKEHRPNKVVCDLIPMSFCAKRKLDEMGLSRKKSFDFYTKMGLRYEHQVPLKVIRKLIAESGFDLEQTKRILKACFQIVWVTKEEDDDLTAAGFKSRMPDGWKLGDDPAARYRAAGIQL